LHAGEQTDRSSWGSAEQRCWIWVADQSRIRWIGLAASTPRPSLQRTTCITPNCRHIAVTRNTWQYNIISDTEEAEVALRDFFANFAAHANLYRRLLGPQGSARVMDHIRRRTTAGIHFIRHPEEAADFAARPADAPDIPHDVSAAFGAGALVGVAVDWLQRGCPGTPEEVAALTSPLFNILDGYDAQSPSRCADAKP
jgi:hypothetical protein